MVKKLRKLQRKLERPLADVAAELVEAAGEAAGEAGADSLGLASDSSELGLVVELCGEGGDWEPRMLGLAVSMASQEEAYETFLIGSFALFDTELGDQR